MKKSNFFLLTVIITLFLILLTQSCIPTGGGTTPTPTPVADSVLRVKGRFLTDSNGNNVILRGVNVPAYKEGWSNDIEQVANAVASTKANVVRLAWWTHITGSPEPQTGTTYYTANDLDRAITTYVNKGILPIIMLHDLTGKADAMQFQNIITAFWTRNDIVAVLKKHQGHLIINIANEWGANWNTNQNNYSQNDINTFINTYKTAITAIRNKGIAVPLMIDAYGYADRAEIFTSSSYGQSVSNGQYLLDFDPQHNLLFSVHTYYWKWDWQTNLCNLDPTNRLNGLVNSGLPFVIGEMGNILPDGSTTTGYADLLTKANSKSIGYLAWSWYNDGTNDHTGTAPNRMNITLNNNGYGDGITIPSSTSANTWGYNILNGSGYGINTATPTTTKINFKK
ncbi:MAG: cellulase family glycosylhydrolase [Chitinophagales bacterium]|nr:cellulase family glycosylhydrolase [Chitinophagales bacterium]